MKLGSMLVTTRFRRFCSKLTSIDLFLQPADFGRVLAELGLQRRALGLDLLHFEIQLVQPLGLGLDLFLLLADAFWILSSALLRMRTGGRRKFRFGELRGLVRAEQAPVDLGQPLVHVVDALAIGFHRLLRGGELMRQPGELRLVDAARVLPRAAAASPRARAG